MIAKFDFKENGVDLEKLPELLKSRSMELDLNTKEIERKYLIDRGLFSFMNMSDKYHMIEFRFIRQGYLSIDPEIRIRYDYSPNIDKTNYYLSYKSVGTLSRNEYEVEIGKNDFDYLYSLLLQDIHNPGTELIYKRYYNYAGAGICNSKGTNIEFEMSDIDCGRLYYMEIEFPNEADAVNFEIPLEFRKFIISDVTEIDYYKMKNYWKTTRIGIPIL